MAASWACESASFRESPPTATDCELGRTLEAATRGGDLRVKREAIGILGLRGDATSVTVLVPCIEDPDPATRSAAVVALSNLVSRFPEVRPLAAPVLARAAQDEVSWVRAGALSGLGLAGDAGRAQAEQLRWCLRDGEPSVETSAARALMRLDLRDGLEEIVLEWIDQDSDGRHDRTLSGLLACIEDPRHAPVLDRFLRSDDPSVRFVARRERSRLLGDEEPWASHARVESEFHADNAKAFSIVRSSTRVPIHREEVLSRARTARLVLFGEMHYNEGPLRDAQIELLRAFVKDPAVEALGYEPSAEHAQRPVLDAAREMGLEVIPMEINWRTLGPEGRSGARDLETLSAIESYLARSPRHRLFVVRGESHVLPNGFLVRRLSERPLIVLSVDQPCLCAADLDFTGSTFRLAGMTDVYSIPCMDKGDVDVLERWLAARAGSTP